MCITNKESHIPGLTTSGHGKESFRPSRVGTSMEQSVRASAREILAVKTRLVPSRTKVLCGFSVTMKMMSAKNVVSKTGLSRHPNSVVLVCSLE